MIKIDEQSDFECKKERVQIMIFEWYNHFSTAALSRTSHVHAGQAMRQDTIHHRNNASLIDFTMNATGRGQDSCREA